MTAGFTAVFGGYGLLAGTPAAIQPALPWLRAVAVFSAYAPGMGLMVGTLSMAVALTGSALAARTRAVLPYVSQAGGVLLLVAGCYVAWYGWYVLRLAAGRSFADPVITAATGIQARAAAWLGGIGPLRIALAFCLLAATGAMPAAVGRLVRRQRARGVATGDKVGVIDPERGEP
jgi:hypothetical protein